MQQQSESNNNNSSAGDMGDLPEDAAMEEAKKETIEEDDQKEGTLLNKYFEVSTKVRCSRALSIRSALWSAKGYMRVNYSLLVDACRNNGAEEVLLHGTKAEFASWLITKQIPYPDNNDDNREWAKMVKPLSPELIVRLNSSNNSNNNSNRKRQRQSINYLENESSSESELNDNAVENKSNRIRNDISEGVNGSNNKNNSNNNYNNLNNDNIDDTESKKRNKTSGWYCYRCSFELRDGMLGCPYHGSIRKWNSMTNQWVHDIPNYSNSSSNSNQNWKIQSGADSTKLNDNNINKNSSSYNNSTDNNQNNLRNGSNSTPLVSAPNNNGGAKCGSQVYNTGNTHINNTYTDPQLTSNFKSNCIVSSFTANHSLLNHTIVKRVMEGQFVPIENFKIVSSSKAFQLEPESDLSGGTFSFDPVSGHFTKNQIRERAINTKKLTSIEEFCVAFLTGLMPVACGGNSEKISDYYSFLSECLHVISILNSVEVGIEYCEEIRRKHQQNNNNNNNNNNRLASQSGMDMNIFQIVSTRNMLKLIQQSNKGNNYGNKSPQNEYVRKPCFKFNDPKGCHDESCRFAHRCSEAECDLEHPRFSYHPLSYQKDKNKWTDIEKSQSERKSNNDNVESQETQ